MMIVIDGNDIVTVIITIIIIIEYFLTNIFPYLQNDQRQQ